MSRAVCLSLFCCVTVSLRAAAASEPAESLFLRANELFQKGLDSPGPERAESIRQAASLYERIIKEKGIRNGYLYYNLGNCYFHLGQIGPSILNYRRAEKLLPNYSDLKRNLKSARARREDSIQKSQMQSITRTLFFWHYVVGLRTKIVAFAFLFSMIWVVALAKLFFDSAALKWGLALCLLFAAMLGCSAAVELHGERSSQFGLVLAEETIPRKGPGESYAASFKESLHEGTEFRLKDRQAGWFQIQLDNGAVCWVNARHVGLI